MGAALRHKQTPGWATSQHQGLKPNSFRPSKGTTKSRALIQSIRAVNPENLRIP